MTRPLVLACGALARELRAVLEVDDLSDSVEVDYLPAPLHNRPEGIVPAIEERLSEEPIERTVLLGYADCGTGGLLDAWIDSTPREVRRLPGAHCYAFLSGVDDFDRLHSEELGTFFLTDFLARHFDALVWSGLGLDRHPELRDMYFGAYTRVVLLTQGDEADVREAAAAAADRLALPLEIVVTGRDHLREAVAVGLSGAGV
ncbi:MAG: DUF1638 domain-containing protein [Actinobacteria bacterium]|jgi:hypothetical protein|nr:DUF1638 domain-containing protein [Actinomycetota bacterium]